MKIVISYQMSVRPSFIFVRIGTFPVLQHHFTGVRTVSPTAGLDRVLSVGCGQGNRDVNQGCGNMKIFYLSKDK